jgi:hypothetical protein
MLVEECGQAHMDLSQSGTRGFGGLGRKADFGQAAAASRFHRVDHALVGG